MAAALTRTGLTGTDDSTAQGNQLIPIEPEVWQQQGSKLQPMGTIRRGNGNVTGGVPFLATTITARERKGPDSDMANGNIVTHALTAEGADASEDGTGRGTPIIAFGHANGMDEQASGLATPTLRAGHGVGGGSVMTPVNWQGGSTQDQVITPDGVSPTLAHAANAHSGHHQPKVMEQSAVRRLTPVECERLQGYPDGWTATSGGRDQSDSARYRQLGNSIAVPVFAWVARRLVAEHRSGS